MDYEQKNRSAHNLKQIGEPGARWVYEVRWDSVIPP